MMTPLIPIHLIHCNRVYQPKLSSNTDTVRGSDQRYGILSVARHSAGTHHHVPNHGTKDTFCMSRMVHRFTV
jgi:hypothetical protein